MSQGLPQIAIVGCGNPNRSDDGAGIHAARLLKGRCVENAAAHAPLDGRVSVLDAGTDGMAVMFAARGVTSLFVVDACRSGAPPGAIFEVPGEELTREVPRSINLHDFRWDHAIYAGRKIYADDFPTDVTVFLIEAGSLEVGLDLSPEVEVATFRVAARIEALVRTRLERGVAS